ncbi:MAG: GRP family sugar transporter [Terracidiphilus sp.]
MYLPATYLAALLLMILTMFCWGSWANTLKLCPRFRFQLFYWDYALGLTAAAVVFGLTAGSLGSTPPPFLTEMTHISGATLFYTLLGGVVFNLANLLIVAAIEVAGLAVAFPIGIGLALVVGAVSNYIFHPAGNPWYLFGGIALVTVAILLDAAAYRAREADAPATTTRGIVLALVGGLLMGCWYPLTTHTLGTPTPTGSGPYAIAVLFAVGVLVSTVPFNLFLMARPLDGKPPVEGADYWRAPLGWHLAGVFGGAVWTLGAVANFAASVAHLARPVGPAVSYSIGQGATMVSACWGVFVWREFSGAPPRARLLLVLMFVFFLLGLGAVALAPLN